jgi:hypothetical protein
MTNEEREYFFNNIEDRVLHGLNEEEKFEFSKKPIVIELDKTQYKVLEEV